jgi:lipopolysaccharide transport system ATP-binding protein
MSSDAAIKVTGLCKAYQIYAQPHDRLKQSIYPRLQRLAGLAPRQYYREFQALSDVSFEVARGETLGVIGRNGSGKSTLLQIVCGTLKPTSGSVAAEGRIGALLELGSGFSPDFTGRENVYLNSTLLGLTQAEIDARYDDILAFADIGNFIDQPVKTYSSGMMVRLAFAVHAQISPDILIVDEALAVGDAQFQAKCFRQLRKLKDSGTSILLVTHATEQIVAHCSRALLLNGGKVVDIGKPLAVANRYLDLLFGKDRSAKETFTRPLQAASAPQAPDPTRQLNWNADVFSTRPGYNVHEYRWGDPSAAMLDFHLCADGDPYPASIRSGQQIDLAVAIHFSTPVVRPILGIAIKTKEGIMAFGATSETLDCDAFRAVGNTGNVCARFSFCCRLAPGDYFVSLGLATEDGAGVTAYDKRYDAIHLQVAPGLPFFGIVDLDMKLGADAIGTAARPRQAQAVPQL